MPKNRRSVFDEILSSSPANRSAATVTSKGTHYVPDMKIAEHIVHSDAPLPMKPLPNDPSCVDLRGVKYGRLTVLGMADTKRGNGSNGGAWVVRCACGDYEHRTTRAIRRAHPEDRCKVCDDLVRKRRRLEELGSAPLSTFIGET